MLYVQLLGGQGPLRKATRLKPNHCSSAAALLHCVVWQYTCELAWTACSETKLACYGNFLWIGLIR